MRVTSTPVADGDVRDLAALRPAWLTVDLDALRANLELLGRHVDVVTVGSLHPLLRGRVLSEAQTL